MKAFEFWYDFSSPFSYLASTQIDGLCARTGARAIWRPFLLGGLFKLIGGPEAPMLSWPEPRRRHAMMDLVRHAELYGVDFRFPSRFPILTLMPLRLVLATLPDQRAPLSHAVFRAFWAEDRDITDPTVLGEICDQVGIERSALERTADQAVKDGLRRATEEARDKGMCGAPTFVVDDLSFWGQDRMHFVEKALGGWRPKTG